MRIITNGKKFAVAKWRWIFKSLLIDMNKKLLVDHINLLCMNPHVNVDIDPIYLECLQKAFIWANEMGLKGKKVTPFMIKKGSDEPFCNPEDARHEMWVTVYSDMGK